MMHTIRLTLALLGLALAGSSVAQERPAGQRTGRFTAPEALNASYQRQQHDLECRRIADLAALAAKAKGPEADAAYRQLFSLAIAHDLCSEAMTAAGRCLATAGSGRDARTLAALAQVLGHAEKGDHDRALADFKAFLHQPATPGQSGEPQDADFGLAVGEAFLQRLIHDSRYDIGRKLCDLACEADAPASLKEHFEDRMARLDLIGKPAPPIAGNDVDGKPVSLADLKGKVVLVDFWATWCPPCVGSIPSLEALAQKYHDQGFAILGVNVDAMHEEARETKLALEVVRRFLVQHRVTWMNVLNGPGASDFAAAYHVEPIPASFLVGRDGRIVALDQNGEMLERAVAHRLGEEGHSRPR